jgi:hypothetical protein
MCRRWADDDGLAAHGIEGAASVMGDRERIIRKLTAYVGCTLRRQTRHFSRRGNPAIGARSDTLLAVAVAPPGSGTIG